MLTFESFVAAVGACAIITGLLTEAAKKILGKSGEKYSPNVIAAVCAIAVGLAVDACSLIFFDIPVNAKTICAGICLIFASWLCAMVGYDKVKQAISQIWESKAKITFLAVDVEDEEKPPETENEDAP